MSFLQGNLDSPPDQAESHDCQVSRVSMQQEFVGGSTRPAMSLAQANAMVQPQQRSVTMAPVAMTSFLCLDDRVSEPALGTPGGDLGEFVLGLSSYLQERNGAGAPVPSQEVVDAFLVKYLKSLPSGRAMVHCTDDRAVGHLEQELQVEGLDLKRPTDRAKRAGLLERLAEVENQGDSHIRLLLKDTSLFQVDGRLTPLVLKAFYRQLWSQSEDPNSFLYKSPKLRMLVLVGESKPEAFIEVSSGESCRRDGFAPMLTPREGGHPVLVSHLDAVRERREEMAAFFARLSNSTPREVDLGNLQRIIDRRGWLALETTGRRIASGLPFFSLKYGN